MTTYFTSDLHIGHVNILQYEPDRFDFLGLAPDDGVTEMNEGIVRLWNSQVNPDDTVYVVGDVAMGKVAENIEYVRQLNGTKYLVMGNHDRPHPMISKKDEKRYEWEAIYTDVGFEDLIIELTMEFDGILCKVSHFPYEGDHTTTERYNADEIDKWVPKDIGLPLVHGHVHSEWTTRGRMFNLGIDAWKGVFQTEETIGAYFRTQGFTS